MLKKRLFANSPDHYANFAKQVEKFLPKSILIDIDVYLRNITTIIYDKYNFSHFLIRDFPYPGK